MSWQIPTTGQWNPGGIAQAGPMGAMVPPDMQSGNYTQEQWALMQQQNWQQWTQWQQQYAQWQSQFGEKYAQQMQAMQQMGGMPPLPPSNAPPPAPPPPDKPPPPPHENDQPLYSNSQGQPVPVSAPAATRTLAAVNSAPAQPRYPTAPNNYENNLGNNQQWSYESESRESHTQPPKPKQLQQPQQQSAQGNAEALKKLAEEERLFDIQFKKWEEEIEKWKRENVNHPDRQAYNEYEQKFEACRAQLLERRKQMNLRRAKLLGNAPQASTATIGKPSLPAANILPPQVPSTPNQNQGSLPKQNNQQQNYYSKSPQYSNQHTDLNKRNINQSAYSQGNNKNIELQDLSNSPYQETSYVTDYSETDSSFLPTSASSKGIPGLDLVSEVDKPQAPQDDVIDITQDDNTQKGPDYNTISKGINNILGDAKIMNILNMVIGQNEPPNSQVQDKQGISSKNINNSQVNSWAENRNNPAVHNQQQQFGNQQNRGPHINHPMQNNQGSVHPMQRNENKGFPMQHNQGLGMQQNQGQGSPMQWQQGPGHANQQNQRSVHSNLQNQNSSHHNELNQGPVHPNQQNQHPGQPNQQNQHPGQPNPQNQRAGHPNQLHHGPGHPNPNQSNQGPSHLNQQNQRPGHPNQQIQGSDYSNQQSQRPSLLGLPSQGPPYQNQLNQGVNQQQNFSQQGPNRNVFNNRQGHEPQDQYFNDDNGPEQGYQNQGYPNSGMQRPGRTSRPLLPNLPGQQQMCEPNVPINMGYQPEHMPPPAPVAPPPKPKWVEEPMFTPSIIVEYEHKPLRMKARDFIEPVHLFDYNHISKDDEYKNKGLNDFGKEFDEELFSKRPPRRDDDTYSRRRPSLDRYGREREPPTRDYDRERDHSSHYERERDPPRDFERRPREDLRDDWKSRAPPRDNRDDRRRPEDRYDDRRRDDRDRFGRRDEKDRERDRGRDRERDDRYKRDDDRNRSRESESRKRGPSIESDQSVAKKAKPKVNLTDPKHIVMIDDLLEQPGREIRPEKVVIILRGPPGSGKSYLAKLIRDREAEFGNTARIMSIDDYFMHEVEIEENDPATGKTVKKPSTKYEYDENLEETYLNSLKRAFKRSITDGFFPFLIFDAVNDQLKSYADVWNFARQNGFQVYICTMERDVQTCFKRNIHNRTLEDIQIICARFFETPSHHIQLDATTLLQNAAITDVHMEDADDDVIMEDQEPEPKVAAPSQVESLLTSKWEKMDDVSQLARLDGTSKPLRSSQLSMEDYLQLDEWQPSKAKPGKKSVRWADIEERREQEKMRAIGFVVGQTDWHRMTDPTMGSSALTQTKYIERVRRI